MTIGEFLKNVRKQAMLTQEYMALKCGVTQTTISRYESDKRPPSFHIFMCYMIHCKAFEYFNNHYCDVERW